MDDVTRRLFLRAQRHAGDRDWDNSIRCYDEIVLRYHKKTLPLEVRDARAAIFIKVRMLPEASMDAKRMIQDFPTDPAGFLRLAQILRYRAHQEKTDSFLEQAVRVLESGARRVDRCNRQHLPRIKLMQRISSDIQKEIDSRSMPDPVRQLPQEIFDHILGFCSPHDRLRWRRVSKCWDRAIRGAACWWQLKIDETFRPKSSRHIRTLVDLASDAQGVCNIRDLCVVRRPNSRQSKVLDEDLTSAILQRCCRMRNLVLDFEARKPWRQLLNSINSRHLTKLEILPSKSNTWEPEECLRRPSAPSAFCLNHHELLELIERLPSLECMHAADFVIKPGVAWSWPEHGTALRSLKLNPCSGPPRGQPSYLNIEMLGIDALARCSPGLIELELGFCSYARSVSDAIDWSAFPNLKCLRFSIGSSTAVSDPLPFHLSKLPPSLKELSLQAFGISESTATFNDDATIESPLSFDGSATVVNDLNSLYISWHFIPWALRAFEASTNAVERLTISEHGRPSSTFIDPTLGSRDLLELLAGDGRLKLLRLFRLGSADMTQSPDSLAIFLAEKCTALETCAITGDCGFSGVGIGALCKKLGTQLAHLDVGRCPRASRDVLSHARRTGIEVRGQVGQSLF